MSVLKIITGEENPTLLEKSTPILQANKKVLRLIRDMKDTLLAKKGLGLAAPQVGENIRLIIVALQKSVEDQPATLLPMINPEIIEFSEDKEVAEEGCLSLPNIFGDVERAKSVIIKFLDEKGREKVLALEGLNARIVQHEIDHLDGILFIRRATKIEKNSKGEKLAI